MKKINHINKKIKNKYKYISSNTENHNNNNYLINIIIKYITIISKNESFII